MNPQTQPTALATAEEVQALRDALAKATPGEWRTGEHLNENIDKALVCGECESLLMLHEHLDGDITAEIRRMPDCRFIALAHNLAPKLLARLDAAEAEIDRLKAGGCARDQRTTQHCADAVAAEAQAVEFAWFTVWVGNACGKDDHINSGDSDMVTKAALYLESRGLLKRTGEHTWQRVEGK